jgi:hypothetical protein
MKTKNFSQGVSSQVTPHPSDDTLHVFTQRNFLFAFGGPPYIHDYAFYQRREISGLPFRWEGNYAYL